MINQLKKSILFLTCVILTNSCFAQAPLIKQWDSRFGGDKDDLLYSFQQTTDGGFILAGYSKSDSIADKTQNSKGLQDYWIVKLDSIGNKQWDRDFGSLYDDYLSSIQQTTDGGFILGGWTSSGIGGDKTQPSWGSSDYWIIKIDSLGNKQWDKDFGGTNDDYLTSIQQTFDGGYILGGWSQSYIGGDKTQNTWGYEDYWIIKIDSAGNKQWDKDFGGTDEDELNSLQQTTDGGFILGGYSWSNISGNKTQHTKGVSDYWIVKTDSLGNKQWDKDFGGSSGDDLVSLKQTTDGGFILMGYSDSDISGDKTENAWDYGTTDFWIIKTDSLGNKEWDKDYGGTYTEDDYGNVLQTHDGGYIMACASQSDAGGDKTEDNLGIIQTWIVKTDSLGNKQWDKTLKTNMNNTWGEIGFVIQSSDSCYVIANSTTGGIGGDKTQPTQGGSDFWIIKLCQCSVTTAPVISLLSSDTTLCLNQCIDFFDLSANCPTSWKWYFQGATPYKSNVQNPENICYNIPGTYNVKLVVCNSIGCDSILFPGLITVLPALPIPVITQNYDTLFASGPYSFSWHQLGFPIWVQGTDSFFVFVNPSSYYVVITDSNGCTAASNPITVGIQEVGINHQFQINPNPASETLTLHHSLASQELQIQITNVYGKIVYASTLKTPNAELNISFLSNGIYFLKLATAKQQWFSKFIVQH